MLFNCLVYLIVVISTFSELFMGCFDYLTKYSLGDPWEDCIFFTHDPG